MAKRSYIQAIRTKQSSAYRADRTSAQAIHRIDGSSKREISSVERLKSLQSWPIVRSRASEEQLDREAERIMTQGWSRYSNPICSSCRVQKALNGACYCS